jgi:hypothetical protein
MSEAFMEATFVMIPKKPSFFASSAMAPWL